MGLYKSRSRRNCSCNSERIALAKVATEKQLIKHNKHGENQRARSDSRIIAVWVSPCKVLCICGTPLTHFIGILIYWMGSGPNNSETRRGGQEAPPLPFLTTICNISVLIVADSNCDFISPLSSSLFSQSPSRGNMQWFEQLRFNFGKLHLKRSWAQPEKRVKACI